MNELEQFFLLIVQALSNVEESYYRTTYYNIENFRMALQHRRGRILGNNFERYGERVFCYEFYHQLRILIDAKRLETPDFLLNAKLQAEVEKMLVLELMERFHLNPLSGEFAPDFLMHTPGNADNHPFAIEVKCEHDISWRKVFKDLEKLNEFVIRFRYDRAVFISVNTSNEHIQTIVDEMTDRVNLFEGRDRIKIINKENQLAEPLIIQL